MSKLAKLKTNADKLREALKQKQEQRENRDTNYSVDWKFKPDLLGNKVTYVVRILPNIHKDDGQGEPWLKTHIHMFSNARGEKKFALCPKTFDDKAKCPICEKANVLFKKVNEKTASRSEEAMARDHYKKPRYYANVLVVEDPRKDDKSQKGKVLVWEFGQQVFDRLFDALVDRGMTFWDIQEGNNFSLVIRKKSDGVKEYPNYEASFFDTNGTALDEYADLDEVEKGIHNLEEKILGRGAKSYDELVALMEGREVEKKERETDISTGTTEEKKYNSRVDEDVEIDENDAPKKEAKKVVKKEVVQEVEEEAEAEAEEDDDDDLLSQLDDLSVDDD